MAGFVVRTGMIGAGLLGAAVAMVPLQAETLEELDAISDISANEEAGIQAARDQADRGELLDALATLERVLAEYPKSREARLIHAIYLCRIDDVQGGLVEIGKLKTKDYGKDLLAEARAMCRQGQGGAS
ncbi:hypothetical protein [Parerythrobacter aestuarii]|uniref:hypothetical protein n=1 Tax=Parerythrobacter aestuarii TaxID=3020909 RepID=UPI0024DE0E8F|nr:hypothetical protein [Parerythrobacter aestuarii]